MKTILYVRTSTLQHPSSMQEQLLLKWLEDNHESEVTWVRHLGREALGMSFFDEVEIGAGDVLVMVHLDRLTKRGKDLKPILRECSRRSIRLVIVSQSIDERPIH